MNTEKTSQTLSIKSESAEKTEEIGELIGRNLKGGEVIELKSDLGGGKTTFVRGLARGMGSQDRVASPSFTISKIYKASKLKIIHFDFYRLQDPGLFTHELNEVLGNNQNIIVIEWADIVKGVLSDNRIQIVLETINDNSRNVIIKYNASNNYIIKELS